MNQDSTLYVGLDVHKDSITVAYAMGLDEVELFGKIGTTQMEVDRLCQQDRPQHVAAECCALGVARLLVGPDDVQFPGQPKYVLRAGKRGHGTAKEGAEGEAAGLSRASDSGHE